MIKKLPSGTSVEVSEKLTRKDKHELQKILFKGVTASSITGGEPDIPLANTLDYRFEGVNRIVKGGEAVVENLSDEDVAELEKMFDEISAKSLPKKK